MRDDAHSSPGPGPGPHDEQQSPPRSPPVWEKPGRTCPTCPTCPGGTVRGVKPPSTTASPVALGVVTDGRPLATGTPPGDTLVPAGVTPDPTTGVGLPLPVTGAAPGVEPPDHPPTPPPGVAPPTTWCVGLPVVVPMGATGEADTCGVATVCAAPTSALPPPGPTTGFTAKFRNGGMAASSICW